MDDGTNAVATYLRRHLGEDGVQRLFCNGDHDVLTPELLAQVVVASLALDGWALIQRPTATPRAELKEERRGGLAFRRVRGTRGKHR